jgi:hypothetical protein
MIKGFFLLVETLTDKFLGGVFLVKPTDYSAKATFSTDNLPTKTTTVITLPTSDLDLDSVMNLDQTDPQEVINGYPINASEPSFTYSSGVLTRVDYPSGFYKELAYNMDGTLNTITYSNATVKTMNWSGGLLQSIGVT